jgi:hypothetical protein
MFLGSIARPVRRAASLLSSVSWLSRQCGILNISQPHRLLRPVMWIALHFFTPKSGRFILETLHITMSTASKCCSHTCLQSINTYRMYGGYIWYNLAPYVAKFWGHNSLISINFKLNTQNDAWLFTCALHADRIVWQESGTSSLFLTQKSLAMQGALSVQGEHKAGLVRHLVSAAGYEGVKMIDTPFWARERERERLPAIS